MGTEVLRPQDCLIERLRVAPAVLPRRRSGYGSVRPNRRPYQKKRFGQPEASISKRSTSCDDLRSGKTDRLVMGQVTILRRGESFDSKIRSEALRGNGGDLIVCGTQRLGPDPEMVPKQLRIKDLRSVTPPLPPTVGRPDMYAGSAFALSPSPSSLPLPSFYKRKQVSLVDDSATKDLRRLLRLD